MSIQTRKLRPVIWPLLNPDTGFICCHPVRADAEGHFSHEAIRRILSSAAAIRRDAFLSFASQRMEIREPEIRALGEVFGTDRRILGIEIGSEAASPEEIKHILPVFREAFPYALLFVPAGTETGETEGIGYILQPNEILDFEKQAEKNCLAVRVDPDDAEMVCFAALHHVALLLCENERKANRPCHAGHRFRVTEIRMDDTEKDRGMIQFTISVDNVGTTPCYGDAAFMLRLCGSGVEDERAYRLPIKASELMPGQGKTVRLDADISGLACGDYDVQAGLFFAGTGDCCSFGIEGRISDGYYEGRLILEL